MAYAELYIGIATVFTRFKFELFETDYEDVRIVRHLQGAFSRKDSKGIRVLVKPADK